MDDASGDLNAAAQYESDLPDLAVLSLADVLTADDSVFARSIRRFRAEASKPDDVVAGHSSALVTNP